MKLLRCPINGLRPLAEFAFGGELRPMPDARTVDDRQWADYVFHRSGEPGVRAEWWYHLPSGTWFIAERDTLRDEFVRTYLYGSQPRGPAA
jgi:sarcosine oxidase subunit delta